MAFIVTAIEEDHPAIAFSPTVVELTLVDGIALHHHATDPVRSTSRIVLTVIVMSFSRLIITSCVVNYDLFGGQPFDIVDAFFFELFDGQEATRLPALQYELRDLWICHEYFIKTFGRFLIFPSSCVLDELFQLAQNYDFTDGNEKVEECESH